MEIYKSSEITVHKLNELREENKKHIIHIYIKENKVCQGKTEENLEIQIQKSSYQNRNVYNKNK